MHLLPASLVLPDDVLSAWQLPGNGVSPDQCILGFGMFMSTLGKATAEDLLRAIQTTMNDAVTFEGRIPVSRAGWQSLQLVVPPQIAPTIQDEGLSDVASDYSGRCYCNDPLDTGMEDISSDVSPMEKGKNEVLEDQRLTFGTPFVPPVTPQEWEINGEMFKRIEALQDSDADRLRLGPGMTPKEKVPLVSSPNHNVPDTLPWPPVSHHAGVVCLDLSLTKSPNYRTTNSYRRRFVRYYTNFPTSVLVSHLLLSILGQALPGHGGFGIRVPVMKLMQMATESSSQSMEGCYWYGLLPKVPLTAAQTQVNFWPAPEGCEAHADREV